MLCHQFPDCISKFGWSHIGRGGINKVSAQDFGLDHRRNSIGIGPIGFDQLPCRSLDRFVSIKTILIGEPTNQFHRITLQCIIIAELVDAIGQLCRCSCQCKASTFAGSIVSDTQQCDGLFRCMHNQCLAQTAVKTMELSNLLLGVR